MRNRSVQQIHRAARMTNGIDLRPTPQPLPAGGFCSSWRPKPNMVLCCKAVRTVHDRCRPVGAVGCGTGASQMLWRTARSRKPEQAEVQGRPRFHGIAERLQIFVLTCLRTGKVFPLFRETLQGISGEKGMASDALSPCVHAIATKPLRVFAGIALSGRLGLPSRYGCFATWLSRGVTPSTDRRAAPVATPVATPVAAPVATPVATFDRPRHRFGRGISDPRRS